MFRNGHLSSRIILLMRCRHETNLVQLVNTFLKKMMLRSIQGINYRSSIIIDNKGKPFLVPACPAWVRMLPVIPTRV
jgi:iron only hydrogenase large subunit-like protein